MRLKNPGIPLSEELKKQTMDMLEECNGNQAEAARRLGLKRTTFQRRVYICMKDKSIHNLDRFIPDGQKLRGVSTLYNQNGEGVMQWVKTNADLDKQIEMIKDAVEALKDEIPKEKPEDFCKPVNSELLSLYVLTDYHIGQMSWKEECGEEWTTEKSVDFLVKWFSTAIASAPNSEQCILLQLGDFLHFDSMDAVTPTSKHLMDTDTRYANMVNVAIKALRRIISMLLTKHKQVHIVMAEGNHDLASSIWLRAIFADKYENEPRITVDNSSLPFYAYEWGKTAIFAHHGHKSKLQDLSRVFAGIFREIFGRTKYAYAHMGHYHHVASKEDSLMIVRQHPTLAAKDAYSARLGHISQRSASVITYSKEYGMVSEICITPEMVKL